MKRLGWLLLAFALCPQLKALTLQQIEASVTDALAIQIAEAEFARAQGLVQQRRSERGIEVFSSAGIADSVEVKDVDQTRSFRALSGTLGLRYPLFGSRLREELALLGAQTELKVADARRALARMEVSRVLRQRFVSYWRHQRRIELSRAFSAQEHGIGDLLFKRQQKGLVLEADRLEFMTAFAAARREEARSQAARRDALATLELLTNQSLAEFVADYPLMPRPCLEQGALRSRVRETNPELAALRHVLDGKGDRLNFSRVASLESGVNLGESFLHDFSGGDTGHATVLSIDLRMPLDFYGASRSARDQAAATLSKVRLELELRMRELEAEALRLAHSYTASQEDLRFAQLRLAAADEAVRERSMRAQSLPGDVQEQLQRARYAYYQVAIDVVDAEAELLDQQAQLLFFSPRPCGLEPRVWSRARASGGMGR